MKDSSENSSNMLGLGRSLGHAMGRPVQITSIGFAPRTQTFDSIIALVASEAVKGPDIIVLPETWRSQDHAPETLDGPTVKALSEQAKRHKTYILCPIDRQAGKARLNSAILLDRHGNIACVYDKVYPYWSEYELHPRVNVATTVPVFQADFGRIGIAICFDVNFPDVWQRLADQGAELVLWPSAYSAGRSLQAHAINHHYYIVTATYTPDCIVYDINGDETLYEKGEDVNVSHILLDLDRAIYHENFNLDKMRTLLAEQSDYVELEQWHKREQWFILRSKLPGISARKLAKEYGLEELRDYLTRSRHAIDAMRKEDISIVADSTTVDTISA
jgi:predicted amidohydrolase